MRDGKKQDLKTFSKIARIVFAGLEKKGTLIQRTVASNIRVQLDGLDKTL